MAITRYKSSTIIDKTYYGTFDFPSPEAIDNVDCNQIRVSRFDRLDTLAFKHLGSEQYWWIIAMINDLDWGFSFEEGQVIRIPVNIQDVLDLI
jgi:hypothetical protein